MMRDEIKRTVEREMRLHPGGTTADRADRIAEAVRAGLVEARGGEPVAERHDRGYHGPHVVLSLDAARHALRCLPDDDVSESAVEIRSKVRAAVASPPAFREPSA
jgi:hypothetical protein